MMPDLVGRQLDQYRLMEEIGRGGMGVVYRAWDEQLNQIVAVKVLAPHLSWDLEFVERFRGEASMARGVKHSNTVAIYHLGHCEGWHYIAMEYLPGQSLARLISGKGAVGAQETVRIVAQLAAGLDEAHRHGLVHRDVKPGNVIVRDDGHATLTDFGLAFSTERTRLSTTGIRGTPEYMAPEQAEPNGQVTPATDQYALATIAFELLTGRLPFQAPEPWGILAARATQEPPSLRQYDSTIPPALDAVVRKALSRAAEQRFRSTGDFARALSEAAGIGAAPPPPPPPVTDDRTPPRGGGPGRNSGDLRRLLLAGGLAILAVLALIAGLRIAEGPKIRRKDTDLGSGRTPALTTTVPISVTPSITWTPSATPTTTPSGTASPSSTATRPPITRTPSPTPTPIPPPIGLESPGADAKVQCLITFRWLVPDPFAGRGDIVYRLHVCDEGRASKCENVAKHESSWSVLFDPGKPAEFQPLGLSGAEGPYLWFVDADGPLPLPGRSEQRRFTWSCPSPTPTPTEELSDDPTETPPPP